MNALFVFYLNLTNERIQNCNIQSFIVKFKECYKNLVIKNRLDILCNAIQDDSHQDWYSFFIFIYYELNSKKKQPSVLIPVLRQLSKYFFNDENELIACINDPQVIAEVFKQKCTIKQLIENFYKLTGYVENKYKTQQQLFENYNVILNELLKNILSANYLEAAYFVVDKIFEIKDSNVKQLLIDVLNSMTGLLGDDHRVKVQQYYLQRHSCEIETGLACEVERSCLHWQADSESFKQIHSNGSLPNDLPNEEHWAKLVASYKEKHNEANQTYKTRKLIREHLDELLYSVVLHYPQYDYAKYLNILRDLPSDCDSKIWLIKILKRNYYTQAKENKIRFIKLLAEYNKQQQIVDPFIKMAIVGLKNSGDYRQDIKEAIDKHNHIIDFRRKHFFKRIISYWNKEYNEYIDVETLKSDLNNDLLISEHDPKSQEIKKKLSEIPAIDNLANQLMENISIVEKQIKCNINSYIGDDFPSDIIGIDKKSFKEKSIVKKISLLEKKQNTLSAKLGKRWDEVKAVIANYKENQKQLDQQQEILKDPDLKNVYTRLLSFLCKDMIAAFGIASNKLKMEASGYGKAGKFLALGGAMIPIPILSSLLKAASAGLKVYDNFNQKLENNIFSNLSFTYTRAEEILEKTTRKIVLHLRKDIKDLNISGGEQFAKEVFHKILILLLNGQVVIDDADTEVTADNIIKELREPLLDSHQPLLVKLQNLLEINNCKHLEVKVKNVEHTTEEMLRNLPKNSNYKRNELQSSERIKELQKTVEEQTKIIRQLQEQSSLGNATAEKNSKRLTPTTMTQVLHKLELKVKKLEGKLNIKKDKCSRLKRGYILSNYLLKFRMRQFERQNQEHKKTNIDNKLENPKAFSPKKKMGYSPRKFKQSNEANTEPGTKTIPNTSTVNRNLSINFKNK